MFNQIENYMTNVDEVMLLIEKYDHLFKAREGSKTFYTNYGDSSLSQLHYYDMPQDLTQSLIHI